ncbi:hypothetical protein ACIQ7N_01305 [Lysinibacillus sp. NPDC095746]|uniref:hypothetical protein n=1 Tax=Lysinibacillus sp. NPDC095746 TaxID=3364134 RepID=UPI00381D1C4F
MDDRIYTGKYVQEKLKISDRKLVQITEYFVARIEGFADFVGKWRKYTEREIELIDYFLRKTEAFDVEALIADQAKKLYFPHK